MTEEEALATEEETEETGEAAEEEEDLQAKLKKNVGVDVEEIGALRRKVTVTIPRNLLDEQTEEQYADLSRNALIPGFRKGRAPRRLVEKRFGKEVTDQLRSQMLGSGYLAAIEKAELKTVSDPMIWVGPKEGKEDAEGGERLVPVDEAIDELVIPSEGDLSFACEVEIRPEFDLPKLEGIPLAKPKLKITEKDVNTHLDRLRGLRGSYEPVAGKIKADDLVVADVTMSVGDEVVEQQENVQLAARGQNVFDVNLPDLGDSLVGKKAEDTVSVDADVPNDYSKADLRGKKASFEIAIHEIKRLALPVIDEAFLLSTGFDSEEDLRSWIRDDLESRMGEALREGLRNQVYKYLLESTELGLPEGLSSRQTDRAVMRKVLELRKQGVPDEEINKHIDELRTGARDEAATQLKLSFVMERIAEERDVHVTEEEVNARIASIAARYHRRFDRVRDDLSKRDGLSSLYLQIRDEKIVDALIADAEITEQEPKKKSGTKPKATKKKKATKKTKSKKSE